MNVILVCKKKGFWVVFLVVAGGLAQEWGRGRVKKMGKMFFFCGLVIDDCFWDCNECV